MEKSVTHAQVYKCKECSYTTTYEHYLERHTKTHGKKTRASRNSLPTVTDKNSVVETQCSSVDKRLKNKDFFILETFPVEHTESLPTYDVQVTVAGEGEQIPAKKGRLLTKSGCDLSKNPICSVEDIPGTHYQQKLFRCHLCEYSNRQRKMVTDHIKVKHLGEAPYCCSECDLQFGSKKGFYKHNVRFHPNLIKKRSLYAQKEDAEVLLSCPDCSFTTSLSNGSGLAIHSMIHTIPKSELFNCHVCNQDFKTQNSLKSHFGRYHRKGEPHLCDLCSYKTQSYHDFSLHIRSHTKDFTIFCKKCDKRFASRKSVRRHMLYSTSCGSHVEQKKRWRCSYCNYSTTAKLDFRDHEYKHLSTEPRYKCDITNCSYVTFRENGLKEHKRKKHGVYASMPDHGA